MKEVIRRGDEVDLFELPVITHYEMDLGPYLTSGSVWIKDPESSWANCAIARIFVEGPRRMVVNFTSRPHSMHIFKKYKSLKRPMPFITVMGHHPRSIWEPRRSCWRTSLR